jgi:hypothetical protein
MTSLVTRPLENQSAHLALRYDRLSRHPILHHSISLASASAEQRLGIAHLPTLSRRARRAQTGTSYHTGKGLPEVRALQAAEKPANAVILSPFAVILRAAKNLALPAQGKLREGSRSEHFQGNARFFVACGSSE